MSAMPFDLESDVYNMLIWSNSHDRFM